MIAKTKLKKRKIVSKPNKQKSKPSPCKTKSKFGQSSSKKKIKQPKPVPNVQSVEEENDQGEDLLDMVEQSDLNFLKKAIANRSYNILNKIRFSEDSGPRRKKQKLNDEEIEEEYEKVALNKPDQPRRALLPIKTKSGVIPQSIEQIEKVSEEVKVQNDKEDIVSKEGIENEESPLDISEPISTIQLLAARNQKLQQRKIDIGLLSAGFLESSEDKVTNLRTLLDMVDEEVPEIHYTVKKLVIMSLLEIFKDVLPSYEIKHIQQDGVKFKKDTLKLYKYEESLLLYYKKYLQKLERFGYRLIRKKGQSKQSEEEMSISVLSIQAMCELLVTHSYFNFAENIAQALVPLMNNGNKKVRETIVESLKNLFKDDKKGDITLKVLRLINNFIKVHSNNVHTSMLEVLLVLNLKGVRLDQEKEIDKKQKKLQAHKARILQLSKKERKRTKKLKEVEKELLETKAEENKDTKTKNLTEITKMMFNIYFRILKNTENTQLLGACFEGLAKFAHYINLEYSLDIITALDKILNEDWLNPIERLHCMQTVFAILSGQGEALNIDPSSFYNRLYKDLLLFSLSTNKDDLIKTLDTALVKRRKKITNKRTIGFVKRTSTLCLQLLHGGSIGCLAVVKTLMVLNRFVDILLDTDSSVGEGRFLPDVDDPEYCNASNTALYEMTSLAKHYHPVVVSFATNIVNILSPNSHKILSGTYAKMSPEQLYAEFDMSAMVFNPVVPVPKNTTPKAKLSCHFADYKFYEECKRTLKTYPQKTLLNY